MLTVRALPVLQPPARSTPPLKSLTLELSCARGERGQQTAIYEELHALGFRAPRLQRNPVTYDWVLVSDFLREHSGKIALGIMSLVGLWLRQKKGRRIEIQTRGLRVKATTRKELERTLTALHHYDELRLTLNDKGRGEEPKRKRRARKRRPKSS